MGLCAHAEQVAFYGLLWGLWKKGFLDPGRPFLEGDLPLSVMLRVKSSALGSKMIVLRKLWRMLDRGSLLKLCLHVLCGSAHGCRSELSSLAYGS